MTIFHFNNKGPMEYKVMTDAFPMMYRGAPCDVMLAMMWDILILSGPSKPFVSSGGAWVGPYKGHISYLRWTLF